MTALISLEKSRAAIHEASHAAIIHRFGGQAQTKIWLNRSGNIMEKSWLGNCTVIAAPGQCEMPDETMKMLGILPAPSNWRVMIGIAGFAGECIFNGEKNHGEVADSLTCAIAAEEISKTDLELIGEKWTCDDVADVFNLLTAEWTEIKQSANWLIEDA